MNSIPAKIVNGKIEYSPISFSRFAAANEGKDLDIVVRKKPRSLSQLGMYRAWLRETASHTGNDEEELHEFLLDRCAPTKVVKINGTKGTYEMEKKKRTSGGHALSMNKLEMGEFMDKCAAMTGYPLPTREELEAMGYILNY